MRLLKQFLFFFLFVLLTSYAERTLAKQVSEGKASTQFQATSSTATKAAIEAATEAAIEQTEVEMAKEKQQKQDAEQQKITSNATDDSTDSEENVSNPSSEDLGNDESFFEKGNNTQDHSVPDAYNALNESHAEMEASRIPWKSPTFTIVSQNRPIADLLRDFGDQQGIRVQVSPLVRGQISGSFENRSPAAFLAQMAHAYGLSWFYLNGLLYIASNQEVTLQIQPLRYAKAEAVISMLKNSGFISSDGCVKKVQDSGMVTVSGIPKYLELTQQLIHSMDEEARFHENGETVIEVFPLNNAWAYDVSIGGAGPMIQGVASTLRQLMWWYGMGGAGLGGAGVNRVGGFANGSLNKYGGFNTGPTGPISSSPGQMAAPNQTTGVLPPTTQQVPPGFAGNAPAMANSSEVYNKTGTEAAANGVPPSTESPFLPQDNAGGPGSDWTFAMITADVRRNAVIIRDIRANMDLYEAAIRKLDVPVRVIEISAAIVDLELGASRTLGLNSVGVNGGSFNIGGTEYKLGGTMSAVVQPGAGSNVGVTGIFGSTAVTAAINALSANNRAKILSRPTILTLDNFGAMINDQETFYVNAVGQYVSNLYNVSTGLGLQVVPHVTMYHGEPRIYLQVQIQDGKTLPQNVGSIPKVEMSTITTQSMIKKDQSLLIGGLFKTIDDKEASGYPWFYKIPFLSYFFGVHNKSKQMVERVFVITPRIVELSSSDLGDYSEYFKPGPTVEHAIKAREADIDASYQNQAAQRGSSGQWKSDSVDAQEVTPQQTSNVHEPDVNVFQATGPHAQEGAPAPTPTPSPSPIPLTPQEQRKLKREQQRQQREAQRKARQRERTERKKVIQVKS